MFLTLELNLGSESVDLLEKRIAEALRPKKMKDLELKKSFEKFDYTQRYQASIASNEANQRIIARSQAEATAAARQARMSSSVADNIAQDTMRAASVIHSSKLGFAAIGTAALGAAFGITSLRSRNDQRRRELERR